MANVASGVARVSGFAPLPAGDYLFRFDAQTGVTFKKIVKPGKNTGKHWFSIPFVVADGPKKGRRYFYGVIWENVVEEPEQLGRVLDVLYNLNPEYDWENFDYPEGDEEGDKEKLAEMTSELDECEVYARIKHSPNKNDPSSPYVNLVQSFPIDSPPEGVGEGDDDDDDADDDEPSF